MDEKVFQEMVDGIIDGLAEKHFDIGDGLDHDTGEMRNPMVIMNSWCFIMMMILSAVIKSDLILQPL